MHEYNGSIMHNHVISCITLAGALIALAVAWGRLIQVISEYILFRTILQSCVII
jgi:hypothetical protein